VIPSRERESAKTLLWQRSDQGLNVLRNLGLASCVGPFRFTRLAEAAKVLEKWADANSPTGSSAPTGAAPSTTGSCGLLW